MFAAFGTADKLIRAVGVYEEAGQVLEAVEAAGEVAEEAGGVKVPTRGELDEAMRRIEERYEELCAEGLGGGRPQPGRSLTASALGEGAAWEEDYEEEMEWREVPMEAQSVVSLAGDSSRPCRARS